jgi:hypothetical protein
LKVARDRFPPHLQRPGQFIKGEINGITEQTWSGRRGSNSQLSAWEAEFSILYFQYLQNRSEKKYVHALHSMRRIWPLCQLITILKRPIHEIAGAGNLSAF